MDGYYDAPLPQEIPEGAFAGFQTASNRPLPPPSATALARAQRMLDEDVEPPKKRARPSTEGTTNGHEDHGAGAKDARRTLVAQSSTGQSASGLDEEIPHTVGFATASGKSVAPPSRAAIARANAMWTSPSSSDDAGLAIPGMPSESHASSSPSSTPLRASGLSTASGKAVPPPSRDAQRTAASMWDLRSTPSTSFATASGRQVAPPSRDAQDRAAALLDTPSRPSSGFATASGKHVPPPSRNARDLVHGLLSDSTPGTPETSGFATASGRSVAPPSQAARSRVANLFAKPSPASAAAEYTAPAAFQTPGRTSGFASASGKAAPPVSKATREAAMALFGESSSTPFRSPLQPKTPVPNIASPALRGKAISITPTTQRRSGVGLSAPRGKSKNSFISPFKRNIPTVAPPRAPAVVAPIAQTLQPVFDLKAPPDRKTYRQAFLKPQYMSIDDLEELDIPSEIWQIDTINAEFYHFETEHGEYGYKHAKEELEKCGVKPSDKWILNHWRLILWKVAGVIQAQPSFFDEMWTFTYILDQLKYRYEREVGNAQRSLVKRIQEHDSSPSLSMVLCVVAIHRPPPQKNDKNEEVVVPPHLELTDGWYHILAQVDDCLVRAINKGKITVGRKLGITGAKLDSGADGAEVMDAFDKSRLILSGNSTSLAKWDVKLGMQLSPFVAALSSLSPDGGIVTMMDVVIDKIFPLAYRSAEWNKDEGEWDQEEETRRQNQWKETYEAEAQKLQDQMQQSLQSLQDLVAMLQGDEGDAGPEPDDLEDRFEALLAQPTRSLARIPPSMIPHLARYAMQYLESETAVQQSEMQAALQTACPVREIRDFRIIRFTDAVIEREPTRIGMLKVWDAKALGEGLQQGKRYMVTNLMATKRGNWTKRAGTLGEVWLQSRRDTRWQIIE